MVYKHADELDKYLEAFDKAAEDLKKTVENLTNLNKGTDEYAGINDVNEAAQQAAEALQEIIDEYEFMEDGKFTKDLIEAIEEEYTSVAEDLLTLTDDINKAQPWTNIIDDEWVETKIGELQDLLARINGEDGLLDKIAEAAETYEFRHKLGDANMDGVVSVTDWFEIMNYAMGRKPMVSATDEDPLDREKFSQLNVSKEDGDKVINVTDAAAVINLMQKGDIHGGEVVGARAMQNESLTMNTTMVNGVRRIALNLNNSLEYTGAQFDLVLPEGMKFVGANSATRTSRHTVDTNVLADGTVRVMVASQSNRAFEGNEGAVVYIDVEGAGDVQFENIVFATTSAYATEFQLGAGQTTGIASVKAAAEGEQVYSIGGRLMNAVKKGINIIRRADGTTQKVIK